MPPFLYKISMHKTLVLSITLHRNEVILIRKRLQYLPICDNTDRKIAYCRNELERFGKHHISLTCDVAIAVMVQSAMVQFAILRFAMARFAMARSAMLRKKIINHLITNPLGTPFKEKKLTII